MCIKHSGLTAKIGKRRILSLQCVLVISNDTWMTTIFFLIIYRAIPLVENYIMEGIEVLGESYHFLSASGSQLREHNAVFVRASSPQHVYCLRNQVTYKHFYYFDIII